MSKIFKKLNLEVFFGFILWFLILFTSLIHSRFFSYFGLDLDFTVSWNYEFTKSILFNILASILWIFSLFFLWNKKLEMNKNTFYISSLFLILLFLSTYFSDYSFNSLYWDPSKWHWLFLFSNLVLIFYISYFIAQNKSKNIIINFFILSAFLSSLIAIKEYISPAFTYWDLESRALWSFGHPNYLSLFLLLSFPFLYENIFNHKKMYLYFPFIFILIAFLLTKSYLAIFLFLLYNLYFFKIFSKKNKFLFVIIFLILIWFIFYLFPYKFNSFFSRFFIWETSLTAIFSDIKIFLVWAWLDNLELHFDSFKSSYLYIFENFWFTADRPHNIIINLFYHLWFFSLIIFSSIVIYIKRKTSSWFKSPYLISIILFLLFLQFNFSSIASYLVFFIFLGFLLNYEKSDFDKSLIIKSKIILLVSLSFYWAYSSINYYIAETYSYKQDFEKSIKYFANPDYYYNLWNLEKWFEIAWEKNINYYIESFFALEDKIKWCNELIKYKQTAESYAFCWDYFWNIWEKDIVVNFYKKSLEILPDLWNQDSVYYKYLFFDKLKKEVQKRYLAEKYHIINILNKVNTYEWNN